MPGGTLPTALNLVASLEQSLRALDIEIPVDIAGNSLGGYMALEAAKCGLARSVVAISPAGLWRGHGAPHVPYVFGGLRFLARHFPQLLKAAVQRPFLRELALALPISIGSGRMPVRDSLRAIDDLATSPAFEATFSNTRVPFSGGSGIAVPVTVAFGDRDWIIPKRWQCGAPRLIKNSRPSCAGSLKMICTTSRLIAATASSAPIPGRACELGRYPTYAQRREAALEWYGCCCTYVY